MVDLTAEWLENQAWFAAYIADADARWLNLTQPELFLLCLVDVHASRREMMAALGRSSSYVADRLDWLQLAGLVVNSAPGQARALVLTEAGRGVVAGYTVVRVNGGAWQLVTVERK